MSLYDIGANVPGADNLITLGSGGAGDYDNNPSTYGSDGLPLNVSPDPGLDVLTTGEFKNSNFTLHQIEQTKALHRLVDHVKKLARKEVNYVRAQPIPNTSGIFRAGIGELAGWSVSEKIGVATTLDLYDSRDASNLLYLATISLAANASDTKWFMPDGISFTQGIYAVFTGGGSIKGSLYLADRG